ncbi:MAG: hypothetical protein JXR70_06840 [Spirochaetales bacterium]|nr:hypothetical protein [Spirochaetales bacterium]
MNVHKLLDTSPFFDIVKYSEHSNYSKDNVAFSGAPQKHPYDKNKIILVADPFSTHTIFYEFKLNDIAHVDELSSLVSESGESLKMVKLWVKKGTIGLRYEPFLVADAMKGFHGGDAKS